MLPVKVYLGQSGNIHRFNLMGDNHKNLFRQLEDKISQGLGRGDFRMYWQDSEGDHISLADDCALETAASANGIDIFQTNTRSSVSGFIRIFVQTDDCLSDHDRKEDLEKRSLSFLGHAKQFPCNNGYPSCAGVGSGVRAASKPGSVADKMWIPVNLPEDMDVVRGLDVFDDGCGEIPAYLADLAKLRPTSSEHNLILYKRLEYKRLMKTMDDVLNESCAEKNDSAHTQFIAGPPGAGKSCTLFAFAVRLAWDPEKNWRVRWVRVPDRSRPGAGICLDFSKQDNMLCIKRTSLYVANFATAWFLLEDMRNDEENFIFVDAYRQNIISDEFLDQFLHWRCDHPDDAGTPGREYPDHRKLVVISSLECNLSKTSRYASVLKYEHCTWEIGEYMDALKHKQFFDSVRPVLEKECVEKAEFTMSAAEAVVHQKFEICGRSVRNMFYKTAAAVRSDYREAFDIVQGEDDIQAKKDSFITLFSRLFGLTRNGEGCDVCYISSFVEQQLHRSVSSKRIKEICRLYTFGDSRMVGFFFEWWVIAMVREGRIDRSSGHQFLELIGRQFLELIGPSETCEWECGIPLIYYTMNGDLSDVRSCKRNFWMVPVSRFQPAFDLVFIHRTDRLIRFIQITIAKEKRSVDVEHLHKFVTFVTSKAIFGTENTLLDCSVDKAVDIPARTVEFCYLIPVGKVLKCDACISALDIGAYGWPKGLNTIPTPVLEIEEWL